MQRNRDCLAEADCQRVKAAIDCLVADQERDHCQHDRTVEPDEVAKVAGVKGESREKPLLADDKTRA